MEYFSTCILQIFHVQINLFSLYVTLFIEIARIWISRKNSSGIFLLWWNLQFSWKMVLSYEKNLQIIWWLSNDVGNIYQKDIFQKCWKLLRQTKDLMYKGAGKDLYCHYICNIRNLAERSRKVIQSQEESFDDRLILLYE